MSTQNTSSMMDRNVLLRYKTLYHHHPCFIIQLRSQQSRRELFVLQWNLIGILLLLMVSIIIGKQTQYCV